MPPLKTPRKPSLKTLCTQTITLDMEQPEQPPPEQPPPEQAQSSSGVLQNAVLQALTKKLDLDGLAQTLVAQVTERLADSITLAELSETIAAQHRDEIKAGLARAVLDRVRGA